MFSKQRCIYAVALFLGMGLVSTSTAFAGETNLSLKYQQSFGDNKYYRPQLGVAHKFDNGFKAGFTQKRQWSESGKESGFPTFNETVISSSYNFRPFSKVGLIANPGIDYQFKHRSEVVRPSFKLYYKAANGWGVGARYRYEYQLYNGLDGSPFRANRYDLYLDYAITDQWSVGWNPSYAHQLGDGGGGYYNAKSYRVEHEIKVGYRIDSKNALVIIYKRKDKTSDVARYNAGKHNDAVQLVYRYTF